MALSTLPFGNSVWDSSAQDLENILQNRGIKLSQKLYREYNLPHGDKPSDFMNRLAMEHFVNDFYSQFFGKILKDKNLTMSDKTKIFKHVWKLRKKYKESLEQYDIELRKLNPELSGIKTNNPRSLVYGALFGFAPKEIAYFSNNSNRDFAREEQIRKSFENYGIKLTYVLAPETADMILSAIEQQNMQYKFKER